MLGQFAIHIVTLIYISRLAQEKSPKDPNFDPDAKTDFEPSLLNSAIYLLQLIQQVSTFAVNYQGRPFRESIRENRGMFYGIVLVTGVAFSCAIEFIPEINTAMKLVPLDAGFKVRLTLVMAFDFGGCWVVEQGLKALYSDFRPKDIALRRPDQLVKEREAAMKELEAAESKKTA